MSNMLDNQTKDKLNEIMHEGKYSEDEIHELTLYIDSLLPKEENEDCCLNNEVSNG